MCKPVQEPKPKHSFPTLTEIKQKIPQEYFESSVVTSMYYVVRSWVLALGLGAALYTARSTELVSSNAALDAVCCTAYALVQGLVFWGFFTVGHDCGHSSFSKYHTLNFVVGCIMHSAILTPYESWRITHRYHHKNTGNIDKDEIFYPHRESESRKGVRYSMYTLGLAWMLYLFLGFAPRAVSHFNPYEQMFDRRVFAVMISVASWIAVFGVSLFCGYTFGFDQVAIYYYAPILVFATFLVVVTFLHHNDEESVWYADSEWNYVKGNLSSIDRDYGPLINNISHNIGTHQVHHLFPIIPHYKLVPATEHFRNAFPHLVRKSDEPILKSFFQTVRMYADYGEVRDDTKYFTLQYGMHLQAQKKAE